MPRHQESRVLPFEPEQLFDLVADIERYPEFLPWVVATRIVARTEREMTAELAVGFRALRERFTSRVALDRPRAICVDYVRGPLRHLHNEWHFAPADGGTRVDFTVDFAFRSRLFERLAGAVFHEAFRRMVASFEARARQLYGHPSSPSARAARTA